ncbi:hypothetical protein AGMMS4957_13680 [Bacteroidia bacterium]|nr:hypothetical protein AGMMS4957_13680 [Bacteroidia bacterium]
MDYLDKFKKNVREEANSNDSTLIVFIIIIFVMHFVTTTIQMFVPDWYFQPWKYVLHCFWILQPISFLLPALAIKNKGLRIVGIILIILFCIDAVNSNIASMVGSER